jgi:rare lipoprotein A
MQKLVLFVFFIFITDLALANAVGDSLQIQEGIASFYSKRFHGRKTSSGEIFDMNTLTAAHKFLPFGALIRVTRMDNGVFVVVKINDRLPKSSKRTIDLSFQAAQDLDMVRMGLCQVRLSAASSEEMDKLIAYYEARENPGLRLRPIYFPVVIVRQREIWPLPRLEVENLRPKIITRRGTFPVANGKRKKIIGIKNF